MSNTPSYEKRFAAFIDILGFKELINRTVSSLPEVSIERVVAALDIPDPAQKDQLCIGTVGDISESGHRSSQFSDSIFISTDYTQAGLFHLVNHIERIAFSFLKLGFLCRGGVVSGMLYHDGNTVFGPALIDAYELENIAIFPRVIISGDVMDFARKMDGGEGKVIKRMIMEYQGCFIVHILRTLSMMIESVGAGYDDEVVLVNIKSTLVREAERVKGDIRKTNKIKWFEKYLNSTISPDPIKLAQAVLSLRKS